MPCLTLIFSLHSRYLKYSWGGMYLRGEESTYMTEYEENDLFAQSVHFFDQFLLQFQFWKLKYSTKKDSTSVQGPKQLPLVNQNGGIFCVVKRSIVVWHLLFKYLPNCSAKSDVILLRIMILKKHLVNECFWN